MTSNGVNELHDNHNSSGLPKQGGNNSMLFTYSQRCLDAPQQAGNMARASFSSFLVPLCTLAVDPLRHSQLREKMPILGWNWLALLPFSSYWRCLQSQCAGAGNKGQNGGWTLRSGSCRNFSQQTSQSRCGQHPSATKLISRIAPCRLPLPKLGCPQNRGGNVGG
jgi:hypothetical protein